MGLSDNMMTYGVKKYCLFYDNGSLGLEQESRLSGSAYREANVERERNDGHSSSAGSEIQTHYEWQEEHPPVRMFVSTVSRTTRGKT